MDTNMTLLRIPRTRLNDSAYKAIKQGILSQAFAPGQRLILEELAQQLGVSLTPLKDALNRLAAEGLVEIVPRRGTYVTKLDISEVVEAFEVRSALEAMAIRLFLERASKAELQEIADMVDQLEALAQADDRSATYQEYVNLDHLMHRRIVELSRNRRLLAAHDREHTHMYMARARYGSFERSLDQAQEEHRALREKYS